MILKLVAFIAVFAFSNPPSSTPENSVCDFRGTVVEDATGEPITGATVTIVELDKQIFTDFNGDFDFKNVKPGSYHVKISFVSYQSASIDNYNLNRNSEPLLVSLK